MKLRQSDIDAAEAAKPCLDYPWPDAAEAERWAFAELERRGIKIRSKPSWLGRFASQTTSGSRRLWLGDDFAERTTVRRAALLIHELRHYQDRISRVRWALAPRYRWRVEVAGYREQAQALLRFGWSRRRVLQWAIDTAARLPQSHAIGLVGGSTPLEQAARIIGLEARL